MEISIESDKIEIKNFIKELCTIYENDKIKIYNQIMKCIEGIEEQEKLKTKKLNRNIRGKIQECKDKLNQRLKEDDLLTDKIINSTKGKIDLSNFENGKITFYFSKTRRRLFKTI